MYQYAASLLSLLFIFSTSEASAAEFTEESDSGLIASITKQQHKDHGWDFAVQLTNTNTLRPVSVVAVVLGNKVYDGPWSDSDGYADISFRVRDDFFERGRIVPLNFRCLYTKREDIDYAVVTVFLRSTGDGFTLSNAAEYAASFDLNPSDESEYEIEGEQIPPPRGTEHLAPWDNPSIPNEDQEYARREFEKYENTESGGGALTATTVATTATGCAGGGTGIALSLAFTIGYATFRLRRRRLFLTLMSIAPIVSLGSNDAFAVRTVSGFIGFHEVRNLGSDNVGSRLKLPSNTSGTCWPNLGNCEVRPLDHVRIRISQGGTWGYDAVTLSDGYFYVVITGGHPGEDFNRKYTLRITFDLDSSQNTAPLRIIMQDYYPYPSLTAASVIMKEVIDASFNGSNDNGTLTVNPSGSGKHTFIADISAVWGSLRMSANALALEGEERHRHVFGGGTGTFDPLYIYYKAASQNPIVSCAERFISLGGYEAQGMSPSVAYGMVYQGRVVDCDPWVSGHLWNFPLFPKDPRDQTQSNPLYGVATSESLALSSALSLLVSYITFWDPETTPASSLVHGCDGVPTGCVGSTGAGDPHPNANASANPGNTFWALWQLVDADTSSPRPGYADLANYTIVTLMNAMFNLRYNSTIYTPTLYLAYSPAQQCSDNDICGHGDVCVVSRNNCYRGDPAQVRFPNSNNIEDMGHQISLDLQGNTAWLGTIESEQCFDTVDNSFPFCRGYRKGVGPALTFIGRWG